MSDQSERGVIVDAKEVASKTFHDVAVHTRNNFPEERYRPQQIGSKFYPNAGGRPLYVGADGTGTKPELAERLSMSTGNMSHFESLAFDVIAMVADDAARDGHFVIGIANALDVNSAEDPAFIQALATGMRRACDHGRFPLLNGETAELGYRTAGVGKNRLNWNAVALQVMNLDKVIDGALLKPGQPIVALRETSIRSNGLSRARAIIETAYLQETTGTHHRMQHLINQTRTALGSPVSPQLISVVLNALQNSTGVLDYASVPWHRKFPELTRQLLQPSTIYTPLIYEAQGGVDGERKVPIVASAHISGGGVPLKGKRMLEKSGLGMHLDTPFDDPYGIPQLMSLADLHPVNGKPLVNNRSASEQWNRGVGFLCAFETMAHAEEFLRLAESMGYEAKITGETTKEPVIEWRGESWDL